MRARRLIFFVFLVFLVLLVACDRRKTASRQSQAGPPAELLVQARAAFGLGELPARPVPGPDTPLGQRIRLGHRLFFEPRLSASETISCNSCHNLATAGVDNRTTSLGHNFQAGVRNAPTVLHAAVQTAQFWDGRAADLEEQAKGPMLNPKEMAMPHPVLVVARLKSIPAYRRFFQESFPGDPDPVSFDNVAQAIADFERQLVTYSAFDRYLQGEEGALSDQAKQGLRLFLTKGCAGCHNGPTVGGARFAKMGVVRPYENTTDEGRYAVTHNAADRFVFKAPLLRNVERTYPYFHDGSVWTLAEAVQTMDEHQLGANLSRPEVDAVVAFLRSLSGEVPAEWRTMPELPASAPETPRPLP